jgi:hypothetical protein
MKIKLPNLNPKLKNVLFIFGAAIISGSLTYAIVTLQQKSPDNSVATKTSGIEGIIGQPACRDTIAASGQSKAECFQAYLLVRTHDGSKEVAKISPNEENGKFKTELPPGDYTVSYIVTDPSVLPQEPQKIFIGRGEFVEVVYELVGQHD